MSPMQGVQATYADPLYLSGMAASQLPTRANITLNNQSQPEALWHVELLDLQNARVDIGGGYILYIHEANAQMSIENLRTGETASLFGEGTISSDGERIGQIWGRTSFLLENGTIITANTIPSADNSGAYMLDSLVITHRKNSLIVKGVGRETLDDMEFAVSMNGRKLDRNTRDGLVLVENEKGQGWLRDTGNKLVDENYLMKTAPGRGYGPESEKYSAREFAKVLQEFSRLLVTSIVFTTTFASLSRQYDSFRNDVSDSLKYSQRKAEEEQVAIKMAQEKAAQMRLS